MIKRLTKHGNSLALVIDRPVLELLKIDHETPLEISTDGQVLIVSPVHDKRRRKEFEESVKGEGRKYKYGIEIRDCEDDVEILVNHVVKGRVNKASIADFFKKGKRKRGK
jgi:antitoxin component of MazEF toxin-antitoxin module